MEVADGVLAHFKHLRLASERSLQHVGTATTETLTSFPRLRHAS